VLCAAAFAFLLFNFHPARLFMGDAGSVPLGFLAGALGVIGWRDGVWPLWFPVLVFAPFVGDATLTLLRRLLRRERIWQAHKDHYYQRLVRMEFGHRGTAWIEYGAMAGCAALALPARDAAPATQLAALAIAVLALGALAVWVDLRWARRPDSRDARA
jgi:UDP-N-acetylmuramyl pentapeptide phosphotransferase/UDP-N-acetylglucosamine-1-phosphate transferase